MSVSSAVAYRSPLPYRVLMADARTDQRLEEVRQSEQAADFIRQEKILKLISTELTKNTTRVVEMAVKSEVQNSVLPSLENITKQEVKAALSNQIAKGVTDAMKMVRTFCCSCVRYTILTAPFPTGTAQRD